MAGHVVTGPLAIAKDIDGQRRYYYKGAPLPSDELADGEIDRLVAAGLVGAVDEAKAKPARKSAGDDKG